MIRQNSIRSKSFKMTSLFKIVPIFILFATFGPEFSTGTELLGGGKPGCQPPPLPKPPQCNDCTQIIVGPGCKTFVEQIQNALCVYLKLKVLVVSLKAVLINKEGGVVALIGVVIINCRCYVIVATGCGCPRKLTILNASYNEAKAVLTL